MVMTCGMSTSFGLEPLAQAEQGPGQQDARLYGQTGTHRH